MRWGGVALGCVLLAAAGAWAQEGLPRDADGWTVLTPSADTRIIYVSSSLGDDATGGPCSPADAAVGADPFLPAGEVRPFRSVAAAMAQAREGFPDWVLLRRGDVWQEAVPGVPSGRSRPEPFVLSAYGAGPDRPVLKTGADRPLVFDEAGFHDVAIVSLHFYASTRDPGSPDYVSSAGGGSLRALLRRGGVAEGLLIEDCVIRFYATNVVLENPRGGTTGDIVLRRNLLLDAYNERGHSQGAYASHMSGLLLEENVFDHNGWLIPGEFHRFRSTRRDGRATMFNHNTYFGSCHDVVFRGNMFLRGASMGNKWRSDRTRSCFNVRIEDNLYVAGELGIGIGGNTSAPFRFANVTVANNVMLNVGTPQPTGRNLGWCLSIRDWDGGLVAGNLFLHQPNEAVDSVYGIAIRGTPRVGATRDVLIHDNIIHGLSSRIAGIAVADGLALERITFRNNAMQFPGLATQLVKLPPDPSALSFQGNVYWTDGPAGEWFAVGQAGCDYDGWIDRSGRTIWSPVAESACDFETWPGRSGEQGAVRERVDYPDPTRCIESYMASLGGEPSLDAFYTEVRKQSKANWRPEFTAAAVNDWIRAGFGAERVNVEAAGKH